MLGYVARAYNPRAVEVYAGISRAHSRLVRDLVSEEVDSVHEEDTYGCTPGVHTGTTSVCPHRH